MAYFPSTAIYTADKASIDAFGRFRTSEALAIFDSKQQYDKSPLFWDESLTAGATSVHSTTDAAVTMSVSSDGDIAVRQTKMRFNYQPGKSQLILMTGYLTNTANVKSRVGLFRGDTTATAPAGTNGLFFEADGTGLYVAKRKNGSDTRVAQASWNLDTIDGNGPSGITIDPTKVQIFAMDYEWLGVGRVRMGFVINGLIYYCHEFLHANVDTSVYMSTPNLPLRYEISSTGGTASMMHICSSVMSEGGLENNGVIRSVSTGATHIDANSADTNYAVIGIRLKSTHLDASIIPVSTSLLAETNTAYRWMLMLNPTVAGTFTYSDITNSPCQRALGATANTVSGGTIITQGYSSPGRSGAEANLESPLRIGATIDGTRDTLVLAVMPLAANADIQGALTWRELL